MNLSQRLLLLSLIPIFLSTIHLEAWDYTNYLKKNRPALYQKFHEEDRLGKEKVHQLEQQMKSFRHRVGLYFRCLRGTCTPEEHELKEETLSIDGMTLGLFYLLGVGTSLWWHKNDSAWQRQKTTQIENNDHQAKQIYNATKTHYYQMVHTHGPNSPQAQTALQETKTALNSFEHAKKELAKDLLTYEEKVLNDEKKLMETTTDPFVKTDLAVRRGKIVGTFKSAREFLKQGFRREELP